MDFNLKQQQWREHQHESEEKQQQSSAKIPRYLLLESPPPQHHQQQQVAALPLFVSPDFHSNKITSHFSDYPDHSSTPTAIPTRFPRGRYTFSLAQWQELELQALIFRHMAAGASVPAELLQLVKKSLLASSTSPYFFHHYSPHYQPAAALMQAGYWGKGAMDPEPGRCRRTDGKKWRCSRDVVAGHKYCERHMHRGRNRSRKPVEFPPPSLPLPNTTTNNNNNNNNNNHNNNNAALIGSLNNTTSTNNASPTFAAAAATSSVNEQPQFSLSTSGPSSFQAFQLNPGSSDKKTMFGPQLESSVAGDSVRSNNNNNNNNNNRVLMQFFDDWPRSDNADGNNISSTTSLSISTPGNPTSDFLRLSTGNGDELGRRDGNGNEGRESGQEMSWGSSNAGGWGANSMGGGPLAEALRSSTNSSSPTSVLHQLRRCSASDTSFVSA